MEPNISFLCHDLIGSQSYSAEPYDPFAEAATILYRVQGRTWLGDYAAELTYKLCVTCLLRSEQYVGENGLGIEGRFAEMPEGFMSWRVEEGICHSVEN